VSEISHYYAIIKKFGAKINLPVEKDRLRKCFDSFSRTLSWFIGMTAYKLVKVKEVEKEADKKEKDNEQKTQDLIIQSNLLSGGIENRFVTLFSTDVQQTIQELIKISNDKEL
jgi:hypothetical protein